MKIRPMAVAWGFYPAHPQVLKQMLDEFFEAAQVSLEKKPESAQAPHAGYIYSWIVAAYTYKAMAQHLKDLPSNIVILAPSHYAAFEGVSVGLFEELQTPLSSLRGNPELWELLLREHPGLFVGYQEPQLPEHAVETQLPFLRYIFDLVWEEKPVLPLVFGQVDIVAVGEVLARLDDTFFVVSSDLSHYLPYEEAILKDQRTLEAFLSQDLQAIIEGADACGKRPWTALTVVSLLKKRQPKLLKYLNSWDTAGDKSRVVGYSSVVYL